MNLRIGIVSLLLAIAAFSVLKSSQRAGESVSMIRARLSNVRALPIGAPVTMAGLTVGRITDRKIGSGYAEIDIEFSAKVDLRKNATLYKRRISMLAGPSLEIDPGDSERPLDGRYIERVVESDEIGDVLYAVSEALPSMQVQAEEGMKRAEKMRARVNGPFRTRVLELDTIVDSAHKRMKARLDEIDSALDVGETLTFDARGAINRPFERVEAMTSLAREAMRSANAWIKHRAVELRKSVDDTEIDWRAYAQPVREIDRGQGTLGTLLNSSELHDDVVVMARDTRSFMHSLVAWEMHVGLRTEYALRAGALTSYLTMTTGRGDRFYYLEFVGSSRGSSPQASVTYDGGSEGWTRSISIPDRPRITFQWATRIGPAVLRYGFKESSFGVGADLTLVDKRLHLSADLFELDVLERPRLKLAASVRLFGYLHMLAGVDDALNDGRRLDSAGPAQPKYLSQVFLGRDFFFGAGLHFDDRDLATLLRIGSSALVRLAL